MSFIYLVPSCPPTNITLEKNTSTSLLISWSAIPQEFIHGVLRAYVIEYWLVDHINDSLNATVEPWVTEVELTNLKKFANYSIKFAGLTSKGVGNWSEVMLQTAEDSRFNFDIFQYDPITRNTYRDIMMSFCLFCQYRNHKLSDTFFFMKISPEQNTRMSGYTLLISESPLIKEFYSQNVRLQ